MKYYITALLFFVYVLYGSDKVSAQSPVTDSSIFRTSVLNAIKLYHGFLKPEKGLYNGKQYVEYASTIKEGIPYFQSSEFSEGSVVYDDMLFERVPLLYDLVAGVVVIQDAQQLYWVQLINDRIKYFTLLNHIFIRIVEDSNHVMNTGFYELLRIGNAGLLKKQTKTIQQEILPEGIKRFIAEKLFFYIKKGDRYHSVNSKSGILEILKDRKNEMADFIKKNKLNFRKAKEYALVSTIEYYNKITSL